MLLFQPNINTSVCLERNSTLIKMKKIKILDCTLRDAGYINNWGFSREEITNTINMLIKIDIDFIELGFIKEKKDNISKTVFSSFDEINKTIENFKTYNNFLAMIPCGFFEEKNIPDINKSPVKILRFIYKKPFKSEALEYSKKIIDKGYKLFINPTYINEYSLDEILNTVKKINKIKPFCYTIVDSKGLLDKNQAEDIFKLVLDNLDENITMGFHSHNNMGLSFINAKKLIELSNNRNLIIDSTVSGLGRGYGNLQTEIITKYLNTYYNKNYKSDFINKIHFDTIKKENS